ncbi:MAG: family glycosyltransferase, 4-amino-4-deoxy-L-arabinose transferase [Schlesneria sp.]|nr:family glycosyltransferase, 4-amino-4-deoxy-L-arabinose transferase [Schlesneria sp.]
MKRVTTSVESPLSSMTATWHPSWWSKAFVLSLAIVQFCLLAICAHRDSFCWDEVAQLPAGLFHWEHGEFGMVRVNPPLVRMVATLPLLVLGYESDWSEYTNDITIRPEWIVSERFLQLNGTRSFWLLTVARITCLPFALLGLWTCWRWAGEWFGDAASVLAATMWTFSPNILGHGHLMTPDLAGTAIGVTAFYAFGQWLRAPNLPSAVLTGVAFGHAQAAKSSWIVLFGMWPVLWLLWRLSYRDSGQKRSSCVELGQLALILLLGVFVLNVWYGFDGTMKSLGDYQFLSRALGGSHTDDQFIPGNFAVGTWLEHVPVPLPHEYIQGVDRQKLHFELPDYSYLRGKWRDRGWWYYYVYGALVKEPIGFWLLGMLAVSIAAGSKSYRVQWRNELLLLAPIIVFTLFISSQRGFNRHLRYLLPVFPFVFIFTSRVAQCIAKREWILIVLSGGCTIWALFSSMLVYPHSLSYFNEWVGGPRNGHNHLLSSNTDWGQDLLYLRDWVQAHPEASPLHLKWHTRVIDPQIVGLDVPEVPGRPTPGWHIISVNSLRGRGGKYAYLLRVEPVATIGFSLFVYHISEEDCFRLEQLTRSQL